jgi:pimeloyl-ACP methyl ester carboxylesterase
MRQAPAVTGAAKEAIPTPPLFLLAPRRLQPINGSAGAVRSAARAEAVLLPEEMSQAVSSSQPLKVTISPPAADISDARLIFPVAFDGRFYYLVGPPVVPGQQPTQKRDCNTAFTLQVTRLPDVFAGSHGEGARERVGIFRAIKLGFFKLLSVPSSDVGLRIPSLEDGKVSYRPCGAGELKEGQVALLVHGFLSDTSWIVEGLLNKLRQVGYQHIVTWDYETITTSIQDTFTDLVNKLQQAGVAPQSQQIDVIAHSMGTLVTRGVIAQTAAPGMVRRALLMGAPNAGTPIANVGDMTMDLLSLFMNITHGPVAIDRIVQFLWKRVDKGLEDLQPGSKYLDWLNASPAGQATPLTLLAGNDSSGDSGTLFQRIFHGGAELFYKGPNDLVVPTGSMKSVTAPPYPNVNTGEVASNHFDYLVPETPSLALVEQWIAKA